MVMKVEKRWMDGGKTKWRRMEGGLCEARNRNGGGPREMWQRGRREREGGREQGREAARADE